jgi:LPS export ABC transporter protein LptC
MARLNNILAILILSALIFGCAEKNEIKAPGMVADSVAVTKARPDQQLRNARIYLYNQAVRTTDIQADYIEKYERQDSSLAWVLRVGFFDSTGKEISNLVSDSGLVRERTGLMIANGHVVVVTEDSSRLETEQLVWNAREDKIKTDKFVRIVQHGDTLTGYGLEADQRLTRIKILHQVSGKMKNSEETEF